MISWLPILGSIILIDLILSGDNALVIGAVAAKLPSKLRWTAFLIGGGGAIVTRILLTYPISLLLRFPILEAVGGILLLIITAQLLVHQDEAIPTTTTPPESNSSPNFLGKLGITGSRAQGSFLFAMLTIIVADVTTSLDNIIAVAAIAKDDQVLLVLGLIFSITFLLIASALISAIVERLPWMILVAAVILTITAADLALQDRQLAAFFAGSLWWTILVYLLAFAVTTPFGILWIQRQRLHKA